LFAGSFSLLSRIVGDHPFPSRVYSERNTPGVMKQIPLPLFRAIFSGLTPSSFLRVPRTHEVPLLKMCPFWTPASTQPDHSTLERWLDSLFHFFFERSSPPRFPPICAFSFSRGFTLRMVEIRLAPLSFLRLKSYLKSGFTPAQSMSFPLA